MLSMPAHFLPPMAARAAAKMAASLAACSLRASSAGLRSNSALLVQRQRLGASAATVHRAWGGVALQPLQFNSFSASASVSATDVAAIISDELKFEQESYEKPVSRYAGAARCCFVSVTVLVRKGSVLCHRPYESSDIGSQIATISRIF